MNTFVNLIPSKNFTFLVLCILFSININAQTTEAKDSLNSKQEVRLDLFQLIVLPGIDVSYERFIDDLSSWGLQDSSISTTSFLKPTALNILKFLPIIDCILKV